MAYLVKLALDTFNKTPSGSVLGQIWLEVGDFSFPSQAWDDFPVVILGWWLESVRLLWSEGAENRKCLFMDGPFYFEIHAQEKEVWLLRFFERKRDREVSRFEASIDARALVGQMLSSANAVIRTCHEKQWHSSDLDVLENHYNALRDLLTVKLESDGGSVDQND